jgi:hypothetical protein
MTLHPTEKAFQIPKGEKKKKNRGREQKRGKSSRMKLINLFLHEIINKFSAIDKFVSNVVITCFQVI